MDTQLSQYLPVFLLALVAVGFAVGILIASKVVGTKGRRTPIKDTAYECGMLPIGEGIPRLSVKFYMVAMLFILFDVEVVFLFPWAVVYKHLLGVHPHMVFGSMLSFLGILFVGYVYAVKKGAFDWSR